MTSVSKNLHIGKLADIVIRSRIKIKPADVKSSTNIDFNKGNNKQDSKLKLVILHEY